MSYGMLRETLGSWFGAVGWRSQRILLVGLCSLLWACTVPAPSTNGPTDLPESPTAETDPGPTPSSGTITENPADPADWMDGPGQLLPVTAQAVMAEEVIGLEVAETRQQQATGLMYRTQVPADRGMLFPFDPPQSVSFWMRNVPISLDMVFLREGEIVAIAADVPPCTSDPCPTYGPESGQLVDQVIELRGGRAAELGLTEGDLVSVTAIN
jgi:uncharacterized membrane protein (UPF0127 family)